MIDHRSIYSPKLARSHKKSTYKKRRYQKLSHLSKGDTIEITAKYLEQALQIIDDIDEDEDEEEEKVEMEEETPHQQGLFNSNLPLSTQPTLSSRMDFQMNSLKGKKTIINEIANEMRQLTGLKIGTPQRHELSHNSSINSRNFGELCQKLRAWNMIKSKKAFFFSHLSLKGKMNVLHSRSRKIMKKSYSSHQASRAGERIDGFGQSCEGRLLTKKSLQLRPKTYRQKYKSSYRFIQQYGSETNSLPDLTSSDEKVK